MPRRSFRDALQDARNAYQTAAAEAGLSAGTAPAPRRQPDDTSSGTAGTPPAPAPAKRRWAAAPSATFSGTDGALRLYTDGVDHVHDFTTTTIPLGTIQGVTVEDGADLEARITATRLVLIGVFALALRKRRGGEKFLVLESTDTVAVVEVSRRDVAKAQRFAAAVRTAAKGAANGARGAGPLSR